MVPQNVGQASASGNPGSGRGPFASALRNLAKQADIKEDDVIVSSNVTGGTTSGNNANMQPRTNNAVEARSTDGRTSSGITSDTRNVVDDRNALKKKTISPQPPTEKVSTFILNVQCKFTDFVFPLIFRIADVQNKC